MKIKAPESILLFLIMAISMDVSAQSPAARRNILVAYFSWAENTREYSGRGVDAVSSASTNTLLIANRIHQRTGGDLLGIQTVTPYTSNYNAVLDQALKELRQQARPPLRTRIADIAKYDVIFLGYPNWWASIPMALATFLESHDLAGKTIVPFCSHGGGRLGRSVSDIAKLSPKSNILEALSISYGGGGTLDRDIDLWLQRIGMQAQ